MKNIIVCAAILSPILFTSSCDETDDASKRMNLTHTTQFEDSIPNIIPGARSVHTIQDNDYKKAMMIVGSPSFYAASADDQQRAAVRTGQMVLRVLGTEGKLEEAKLVITKLDNNENKAPADGISLDMKIDSLKKVMFPK